MLETVVSSSVLILVLAVLRRVLRGRVSPRLQYALWGLVLLRLLVPVSLGQSRLSAANLALAPARALEESCVWITGDADAVAPPDANGERSGRDEALERLEPGVRIRPYADELPANTTAVALTKELRTVWLGGACLLLLCASALNMVFAGRLKRGRREYAGERGSPLRVYVSGVIPSPCLYGVFRPAVYVTPESLEGGRLRYVLAHEKAHYRQLDHIWALLRGLCLCLYWFDPLVWLAASLSRRDGELSCDEAAISALGEGSRFDYGRTLVGMVALRRDPLSLFRPATTMTGGGKSVALRVRQIARKPKMAVYTLLAVLSVTALAAACTFTGAAGAPEVSAVERVTMTRAEREELGMGTTRLDYRLSEDARYLALLVDVWQDGAATYTNIVSCRAVGEEKSESPASGSLYFSFEAEVGEAGGIEYIALTIRSSPEDENPMGFSVGLPTDDEEYTGCSASCVGPAREFELPVDEGEIVYAVGAQPVDAETHGYFAEEVRQDASLLTENGVVSVSLRLVPATKELTRAELMRRLSEERSGFPGPRVIEEYNDEGQRFDGSEFAP